MKIVVVKFLGSMKEYEYFTNLDLIPYATYKIIADDQHCYETPVVVIGYRKFSSFSGKLRTITNAVCIHGGRKVELEYEKVYFNRLKGVTALKWKDGVVTKIKRVEDDPWDEEKAVLACIVKRFCGNRGYYNDIVRDLLENAERDYNIEITELEEEKEEEGQ